MNIRKKMVWIVTSGILVSAIFGTVLVYEFVQQNVLETEISNLQQMTTRFTSVASQRFSESEPKIKGLARLLETELAKPISKDELKEFHRIIEKNSDGVWRNRKASFNGKKEAGVFLPSNPEESDLQKIQHLRIKKIMDIFGASANERMENIWYLSQNRSEIIFDANLPDFAFEQKADNDYTQTPWVTYTTPELNPNKELRFTPPLFDPVPKLWMVSAIYPLYVNNKWVGSLGEDMPLTGTLEFMFQSEQLYKNTEHFLIDNDGNFVLAGAWQKELEASSNGFKPNLEHEPALSEIFKATLMNKPKLLTDNLVFRNNRYVAIGMRLEPLNWSYYLIAPVDEIMSSTQSLFLKLLEMILLVGVVNGLLVFTITGQTITKRIKILTENMARYSENHSSRAENQLLGTDEISQAASAFYEMTNQIEAQQIELQSSRDQYAALVINIPGITFRCAFDADWTMLFMSGLVEELTGYPESDFIHNTVRTYASIIYPDDSAYVDNKITDAIKENRPYTIEYRVIDRLGKIIWVHERGRGVANQTGEMCFIDGFILDISQQKSIDAERHRLLKIIDESPEFVGMSDMQANLKYLNRAAKEMVGLPENADISKLKINDMHPKWAINLILTEGIPAVLENGFWKGNHALLNRVSNFEIPVSQIITVHRDEQGNPQLLSTIIRDISKEKEIEQMLVEAKESAESLAKSKSEFLANMSHEIRTPMTAIIGLSQLSLNKEMPEDVRDSLTKIYQSSNSLLGILNDILDFSKLDAGKLTLENSTFSLATVFRNLHNLFSVSAKSKNLEFSISVEHDVPNKLIGDALRIQQILSNLLGNAIKFTEHGKIELHIKQIKNRVDETVLRFSVEDTGIGIKVEQQENLFKPFHQADNSITRRFGGTGLGLTISRDLLVLMGSDFHINSVEGKGTTIYFDLLLKIPSMQTSKQSVSMPSNQQGTLQERLSEISKSLTGTKILLAEDNSLNQEIVSGFLKMSGIEVDIADNGIIALELLKLNSYDAILMDIHMPEMDGLQATKIIREQSKYANLPIIALTAGITTEEQDICLSVGMTNFVEKPINPEVLLQTLSRCVKVYKFLSERKS